MCARYIVPWLFQSTLPVRGGTGDFEKTGSITEISIHPPREGRDLSAFSLALSRTGHFNPPSP